MFWASVHKSLKRLENSQFSKSVRILLVIVSGIAGFLLWLHSERVKALETGFEAGIKELNAKHAQELASERSKRLMIIRRLGDDTDLSLTNLIVFKRDVLKLSPEVSYFDEDSFYAPTNIGGLFYERLFLDDLSQRFSGSDGLGYGRDSEDFLTDIPIHLWSGTNSFSIGNHDVATNIFPCVFIARLPAERLKNRLSWRFENVTMVERVENINSADPSKSFTNRTVTNLVLNVGFESQSDVLGRIIAAQMGHLFLSAMYIEKLQTELMRIQKLHNVCYAQIRATLFDAEVNGKKRSKFYVYVENIVISRPPDMYVIYTLIPSFEAVPRGDDVKNVSDWISEFMVLADP